MIRFFQRVIIFLLLSVSTLVPSNVFAQTRYSTALLNRAKQGNSNAQLTLAECYRFGRGIQESKDKALMWYKKAIEKNNYRAMENCANMIDSLELEEYENYAYTLHCKAADAGLKDAQYNMAFLHFRGIDFKFTFDPDKAMKWLLKSVEQNYPPAQALLGSMYEYGGHVKIDKQKALLYYRKAAAQGDKNALYDLGRCYLEGKCGLSVNRQKGIELIRKSASKGCYSAKEELKKIEKQQKGEILTPHGDKKTLDLVYHPFGYMKRDGEGLNYSNMLLALKKDTDWKIDEYDTHFMAHSIVGLGITWKGYPITTASFSYSPEHAYLFQWEYNVHIPGSIQEGKVISITKQMVNELVADGFKLEYKDLYNSKLNVELKKEKYKVDISLYYIATDNYYFISLKSYPRYN